ncbi:MAG: hypothetical protein LBE16_02520 [Clostridiales Family XIII bacterium]|jgi:transglutaminase-like putative cysteine protease|nr:hypothetical protein [Clostridiales Family XIII bacterium]
MLSAIKKRTGAFAALLVSSARKHKGLFAGSALTLVLSAAALAFGAAGFLDFSAPVAVVREVYAIQGEALSADLFLAEVRDGKVPAFLRSRSKNADDYDRTARVILSSAANFDANAAAAAAGDAPAETDGETPRVFAYYEAAPDTSVPGERDVTLILEDPRGNRARYSAKLTVLSGKTLAKVEAADPPPSLTLDLFFTKPENIAADFAIAPETLDTSSAGAVYDLPIRIENRIVDCKLTVSDTSPPSATVRDRTVCTLDSLTAEDFVSDIRDMSDVSADFVTPPIFGETGTRDVDIKLTDAFGNESVLTAALTVVRDTEKPKIAGVRNRSVFLNSTIGYREGVSVSDDFDNSVRLEIDSSAVNPNAPGRYPVYYRAIDASGNERSVSAYISVLDATETSVYGKADEILGEITHDAMSPYEKARAIYNWVSANVAYINTGSKREVLQGALDAFVRRRGDCYTYYAAGEVLLTRAGIDNIGIRRIDGTPTTHYWSLVNTGDGWRHFDTCPAPISNLNKFMFTEKTAKEYTQRIGRHYYDYDPEKYPVVAEE